MDAFELTNLIEHVLDRRLFTAFGTQITVGTGIAALAILAATWLLSRAAQKAFERVLAREDLEDPGTVRAGQRLAHFVILLIGMGVALETVGFDLTALFTAGAVFAIGFGFAMQNIAQNFVSGVILLIERSIKPGDVLEVEGRIVKVARMGIRATVARTLDEEDIIIPNSVLVQTPVKNYTYADSLYRLRTSVGVVYGSDMKQVLQVLDRVAREVPWRVAKKEPRIFMVGFGDSSVDFEVGVWISDPWRARIYKSELNQAIWWALKEADIVIAFPQLDLHLDPPVVESLRLAASTGV
jgi:small-conductance mechanosensitive channel